MNKEKFFVLILFISCLLIGGITTYYFYLKTDEMFINRVTDHLKSVSELKAGEIKLFLEGKENRAVDFSSDGFIKNSLYKIKNGEDTKETEKQLSRHLIVNKLPVDESFYKVMTLGINGVVVASTDNESIGLDLTASPIFLEGKERPYVANLSYDDISRVNSFTLAAPVLREGEFVGVVVIKMLPDALMKIMMEENNLGEKSQTYIINQDGYLVTPSKFLDGENKGVLTQKVDTENSKDCLKDLKELSKSEQEEYESDLIIFTDFRGEEAIGSHNIIPDMSWCLLAEADASKAWEEKYKTLGATAVVLFICSLIISMIWFFTAKREIKDVRRH